MRIPLDQDRIMSHILQRNIWRNEIIYETSAYIAMEPTRVKSCNFDKRICQRNLNHSPELQPELLFREILHIKEPLVGSLAFFHFGTEQGGSS